MNIPSKKEYIDCKRRWRCVRKSTVRKLAAIHFPWMNADEISSKEELLQQASSDLHWRDFAKTMDQIARLTRKHKSALKMAIGKIINAENPHNQ